MNGTYAVTLAGIAIAIGITDRDEAIRVRDAHPGSALVWDCGSNWYDC